MKVYKIDCEWDMGFEDLYYTKEAAQKAIDNTDWESMVNMTLEEVIADNMVIIEEIIVKK